MNEEEASSIIAGLKPADEWVDARSVATTQWRQNALDFITDESVGENVALVELDLNESHESFVAIARIDDRGIWYTDGDGSVRDPAWRLRLLPWRHIDYLTLHQAS
jgi:hypothetical protein